MSRKPYETSHQENLARLARIEGQVRGVSRMIKDQDYCIDIITQIQAVQSALRAVARNVLEKHLNTCVARAMQSRSSDDMNEKMGELMKVIKRMCK